MKGLRIRTLALSLAGTSLAGLATPLVGAAQAQDARARNFNIPAQDMATALEEFGRQSGRDILFDRNQVAGLRSNAVEGRFEAGSALSLLTGRRDLLVGQPNASTFVVRRASGEAEAAGDAADEGSQTGSEIVVTGTNIRSSRPVGSDVIVLDRTELDRTGYGTVQDYLETLPQNFAANVTEVQGATGNFSRGSGVNLRGLGAGATLVLVNGRRQAASGDIGDFTDVSGIPASAIERIEILTDGASAIYGSDAVAGVVNIILRRDFRGLESRARVATAGGEAEELRLSQTGGLSWSSGNILAGYQYYHRSHLQRLDRDFSSTNDQRRFGGDDFRVTANSPGNILCPAGSTACVPNQPAFGIPLGQNGRGLTLAQLIPGGVRSLPIESDLLPETEIHSLFGTARQELASNLEFTADARFSSRLTTVAAGGSTTTLSVPAINPFYFNPFGTTGTVRVAYNFVNDLGPLRSRARVKSLSLGAGLEWRIDDNLRARFTASHGSERTNAVTTGGLNNFAALTQALNSTDPATAFNAFCDAARFQCNNPAVLAAISPPQINVYGSTLGEAGAIVDGALLSLPAGEVRFALGANYRHETSDTTARSYDLKRDVSALFGEIVVPVLAGRDGDEPLLQVSAAARWEHYSDFGSSLDPRFGLSLSPSRVIRFRASYGTSFRAPRLSELDDLAGSGVLLLPIPDPRSSTGSTVTLLRFGNNSGLGPETSRAFTLGTDIRPSFLGENAEISVTYYNIRYRDRIITPGGLPITNVLTREDLWSELINRSPTQAQVAEACALITSGSCTATPPLVIADVRLRNISRTRTDGIDVSLSNRLATDIGTFFFALNGTYIFNFDQKVSAVSPRTRLLNTRNNPVDLRFRFTGGWTHGDLTIDGALNYTDDYLDSTVAGARTIGSWLTADLGASYRLPFLRDSVIAVRAVNILDRRPPFVNVALGFDSSNASPIGRLISLDFRHRW